MATYLGKLLRFNGTAWDTFDITPAIHGNSEHETPLANRENGVYYVVGNTTGTAGVWTGTISEVTAYYDGLKVDYKIGIAGNSTTTLNINGLGAKTVLRNTGNLTTHLPVNTIVHLTLTTISSVQYWVWADYDSDDIYQLRNSYYDISGLDPIYSYKIVAEGSDGCLYPLTLDSGTGLTKVVSTRSFKLGGHIKFYVTSATIAASTITRYYMATQYSGDGLYTFNSSSGFIQGKAIYLKAVIQSDGSFKLDNTSVTSFYTQTLPTTDDGFIYIKLGTMHDTTRCITLLPDHPIYQFKDGCLRLLIQSHNHTFGVVAGTYAQGNDARFVQGQAQFFSYCSIDGGISPDNVSNNAIVYVNSLSLFGQNDGASYSQAYSSSWVHQIYGDYRTGQLAVRGHRGDTGVWTAWRRILDETNYGSYVTPAGIGAMPKFAGITTVTSSRNLATSDVNYVILANSGSAIVLTIPASTFTAGSQITIVRKGSGSVTVTANGSVLFNGSYGASKAIASQNGMISLICAAANEWYEAGVA